MASSLEADRNCKRPRTVGIAEIQWGERGDLLKVGNDAARIGSPLGAFPGVKIAGNATYEQLVDSCCLVVHAQRASPTRLQDYWLVARLGLLS